MCNYMYTRNNYYTNYGYALLLNNVKRLLFVTFQFHKSYTMYWFMTHFVPYFICKMHETDIFKAFYIHKKTVYTIIAKI